MNANQIYAGEYYAIPIYSMSRGTFPSAVYKGKAVKVRKRREYGNTRLTTYVEFELVNSETNEPILKNDGSISTIERRSRDVWGFWDQWEGENHHREVQRQLALVRREENARVRELERQKLELNNEIISRSLKARGLHDFKFVGTNSKDVIIPRRQIIYWLGLNTQGIE